VQAILLPQTWEEASLVAEFGNQAKIPILSITDSTPIWATKKWPFLLQASPDQNAQMKAIAAIVASWEWHQVNVIYEDIDSFRSGVTPHLSDALREVGVEVSNLVALSPFDSSSLSTELERLESEQCRVFLVHMSLPLAEQFFVKAKEMNMTEKDYVWITTNPITSLVHSLNVSTISSMQGTVGVKSYYPQQDPHFIKFHTRFRKKFSLENPDEDNREPGTSAMQAYDVVRTVCLAMRESSNGGQQLLDKIMLSKINGSYGRSVQFIDRKVAPAQIFQIINVIGKSYNELGFWSYGKGFSKTTGDRAPYNTSMRHLKRVFWPGGPWTTPRGWIPSTNSKPLRIAVPTTSSFKQYVKAEYDNSTNTTSYSGFAINLFKATIESLPFDLQYNFTPFDGSYDQIVEQIYLKVFFLTNQVIVFFFFFFFNDHLRLIIDEMFLSWDRVEFRCGSW
jgi:ABC-type branched-subunit amino acid transport system substrate-binding protein